MGRTNAKASTSKHATPTPAVTSPRTQAYGHDLHAWPRSWRGGEEDLPPGEELVACFRPFIACLAASDLAPTTIRRHVDNFVAPGRAHQYRSPRDATASQAAGPSGAPASRRRRRGGGRSCTAGWTNNNNDFSMRRAVSYVASSAARVSPLTHRFLEGRGRDVPRC